MVGRLNGRGRRLAQGTGSDLELRRGLERLLLGKAAGVRVLIVFTIR